MVQEIYAFEYLPCIFEGSWGVISVHKTEAGALQSLEDHKQELLEEYNKSYGYTDAEGNKEPFGQFEGWRVRVYKVSK